MNTYIICQSRDDMCEQDAGILLEAPFGVRYVRIVMTSVDMWLKKVLTDHIRLFGNCVEIGCTRWILFGFRRNLRGRIVRFPGGQESR